MNDIETAIMASHRDAPYLLHGEQSLSPERQRPQRQRRQPLPWQFVRVQQMLGDSVAIMNQSVRGLLERGVRLKKLASLTASLSGSADTLRERSVHLNRDIFCLRVKLYTCAALSLFSCIAIFSFLLSQWTNK